MTLEEIENFRIRLNLSMSGHRAVRLREIGQVLGLGSDTETAHYLINRGMEACAMQVVQRDQVKKLYADIRASMPDMQTLFDGLEDVPQGKA